MHLLSSLCRLSVCPSVCRQIISRNNATRMLELVSYERRELEKETCQISGRSALPYSWKCTSPLSIEDFPIFSFPSRRSLAFVYASHWQMTWCGVSSSSPQPLHSGLSASPMLCRCLFRRQWPVTISVASFIFVLPNCKMDAANSPFGVSRKMLEYGSVLEFSTSVCNALS